VIDVSDDGDVSDGARHVLGPATKKGAILACGTFQGLEYSAVFRRCCAFCTQCLSGPEH
jgi:hypothetical protein